MQVVKKTAEYRILKRNDNRFAVKNNKGQFINGEEKVAILMAAGLLVKPEPKPTPVEEVTEVVEEASTTEETPAEEPTQE